jgi:hypothetical protein
MKCAICRKVGGDCEARPGSVELTKGFVTVGDKELCVACVRLANAKLARMYGLQTLTSAARKRGT